MLILTLALIQNATAPTSDEMQTFFSKDYVGISIEFNATRETTPDENVTINLWINCTAADVNVECLTLSIYGFRYGKEKILLKSVHEIESTFPLVFNHTEQYNYTVHIPHDVWDAVYAEMHIEYTVVDSTFEENPNFSITIIRNVYLEELENMFKNLNYTYWQLNQTFWESFQMNLTTENLARLNQTHWELQQNYTELQDDYDLLNKTHWQLNQTFWECFQMNLTKENLDGLNQTYWELQQNYTSVQGSLIELGNTRIAVIILAITTIFFVATTFYVVMRKPKQYW